VIRQTLQHVRHTNRGVCVCVWLTAIITLTD